MRRSSAAVLLSTDVLISWKPKNAMRERVLSAAAAFTLQNNPDARPDRSTALSTIICTSWLGSWIVLPPASCAAAVMSGEMNCRRCTLSPAGAGREVDDGKEVVHVSLVMTPA